MWAAWGTNVGSVDTTQERAVGRALRDTRKTAVVCVRWSNRAGCVFQSGGRDPAAYAKISARKIRPGMPRAFEAPARERRTDRAGTGPYEPRRLFVTDRRLFPAICIRAAFAKNAPRWRH